MNLIKKIIPTDEREAEERFERIRHDAIHKVDKDISGVAKEVTSEVAPTDFIAAMYAPSSKKPESGSGESAGFGEQVALKPGEVFADVSGSPGEPGQKPNSESGKDQLTVPAAEIMGAVMGSPLESGENPPTEDPVEQLLPTSGQVAGHLTGSIQTERVTPHMETPGQQLVPNIEELAGLVGISSESGKSSAAGQDVEQMAQQGTQLDRAGIDPAMQMTSDERSKLNQEQKEKREHMMLHEREYRKFGTPLDDIGTLEEQVSKVRQQKEQEEKQKLEEEEEEKKRKEEEEKQKQQELPEPSTKAKPGDPNIAVGQSQKKTEVHRGASG